jgi:hypothetical protein
VAHRDRLRMRARHKRRSLNTEQSKPTWFGLGSSASPNR